MADNLRETLTCEYQEFNDKYAVKNNGLILRTFDDERDAEDYMDGLVKNHDSQASKGACTFCGSNDREELPGYYSGGDKDSGDMGIWNPDQYKCMECGNIDYW